MRAAKQIQIKNLFGYKLVRPAKQSELKRFKKFTDANKKFVWP